MHLASDTELPAPDGKRFSIFWDKNASAIAPLIVGIDDESRSERHYYFWFFGQVVKLPYERQVNPGLSPAAWQIEHFLGM